MGERGGKTTEEAVVCICEENTGNTSETEDASDMNEDVDEDSFKRLTDSCLSKVFTPSSSLTETEGETEEEGEGVGEGEEEAEAEEEEERDDGM